MGLNPIEFIWVPSDANGNSARFGSILFIVQYLLLPLASKRSVPDPQVNSIKQ